MLLSRHEVKKMTYQDIESASQTDNTVNTLRELIKRGFELTDSESRETYIIYKTYCKYRQGLHVNSNGIIYYKNRLLVPAVLRDYALQILHIGHQGVYSMNLFAEDNFFWPGITNDITKIRETCWSCNENAPSLSNLPPQPVNELTYPFQMICIDYCSYAGKRYGIGVDRYSNFPNLEGKYTILCGMAQRFLHSLWGS